MSYQEHQSRILLRLQKDYHDDLRLMHGLGGEDFVGSGPILLAVSATVKDGNFNHLLYPFQRLTIVAPPFFHQNLLHHHHIQQNSEINGAATMSSNKGQSQVQIFARQGREQGKNNCIREKHKREKVERERTEKGVLSWENHTKESEWEK